MEFIKIYKSLFAVIFGIMLFSIVSCSEDSVEIPIIDPDNPAKIEDVKGVLESAITEWGISQEKVMSSMNGYNQVEIASDMLLFKSPKGRQGVSYFFDNGKLCATSVIFPATSTDIDLHSLFEKYSFIGELGGGKVYDSQLKNTMAAVWQTTEYDSTLCAIGFAPIKSDSYEEVEPIVVATGDDVAVESFSATISGKITGVDKDVEVGIIYGKDGDISEIKGKRASTISHGDFNVPINGLIGEQTYYYRAYALVDDMYYLGEIKSFNTPQLVYTIDGKSYKMIKVEGGGKDFSIMQTELPPNSEFKIGTNSIGIVDANKDNVILRSEFGNFIDRLRSVTGIPFRLPTREEWEFAARGGNKASGFIYSGSNDIDDVGWYKNNSGNVVHSIALKSPNELGIYDMSGNYAELCNEQQERLDFVDGPFCGGSWQDTDSDCTVSSWKEGSSSVKKIPGTDCKELNAFDARYITIRLVYSRQEE